MTLILVTVLCIALVISVAVFSYTYFRHCSMLTKRLEAANQELSECSNWVLRQKIELRKSTKSIKRYFIVFYSYKVPGDSGTGNAAISCSVGYLNNNSLRKALAEDRGWNHETAHIVFTNIIELSESDYNDWIGE